LKGIAALAFNPSGSKLVAAAIDDNHFIAIYDVEGKALLDKKKSGPDVIIALAFGSDTQFITVGVKHYKCWPVNNGKIGEGAGTKPAECSLTCAEPNGADYIVGLSTGQVQVYGGTSKKSDIVSKVGEGTSTGIDALHVTKDRLIKNSLQ
jgi:hypothetical protein